MESLSLGTPIVSESSIDQNEYPELQGVVRYFKYGSTSEMINVIREMLENPPSNEDISNAITRSASKFKFMFNRFLLGLGFLPTSFAYKLPIFGEFSDKIVLSLPETIERRRAILKSLPNGFVLFDGLRRSPGWVGCGMSYSFLAKKALEKGVTRLTIIEDDVLLPDDFEQKLNKIYEFLDMRNGEWDVFVGMIADLHPEVEVFKVEEFDGIKFVFINKMTSTVCNIYSQRALKMLASWNPENLDPKVNTIDRFLENWPDIRVVTTLPFLVGQKECLESTIWGFTNIQYREMIRHSEQELQCKVWLQHFLESD